MHAITMITILNHFGELFEKHWLMFRTLLLLDSMPDVNVVLLPIVQASHTRVQNFKSLLLIEEFKYAMKMSDNHTGIIPFILSSSIIYIYELTSLSH